AGHAPAVEQLGVRRVRDRVDVELSDVCLDHLERRHPGKLRAMPASKAVTVDAGEREVRVSSPDRVNFPATEHTAAVTKLEVVEYYVAVEDGIMRALRDRPTALERWPKGVQPGFVLTTREGKK